VSPTALKLPASYDNLPEPVICSIDGVNDSTPQYQAGKYPKEKETMSSGNENDLGEPPTVVDLTGAPGITTIAASDTDAEVHDETEMQLRVKKQEELRVKDADAERLRLVHDETEMKLQEDLRVKDADAERLRLVHDETEMQLRFKKQEDLRVKDADAVPPRHIKMSICLATLATMTWGHWPDTAYRIVFVSRGHPLTRSRRPLLDAQRHFVAPSTNHVCIPLSIVGESIISAIEVSQTAYCTVADVEEQLATRGWRTAYVVSVIDKVAAKGYCMRVGDRVSLT